MRGESSPKFRRPPHYLIIDDSNSGRSQMAEAFMRQQAGDLVEVLSAGMRSEPIDRKVVQVMGEIGIDIRRQQEKLVSRDHLLWADVIIIINDPDETIYPAVPSGAVEKHWLIAKPPSGDDGESLQAYRETRDLIMQRVESLTKSLRLFYGRNRPAMKD